MDRFPRHFVPHGARQDIEQYVLASACRVLSRGDLRFAEAMAADTQDECRLSEIAKRMGVTNGCARLHIFLGRMRQLFQDVHSFLVSRFAGSQRRPMLPAQTRMPYPARGESAPQNYAQLDFCGSNPRDFCAFAHELTNTCVDCSAHRISTHHATQARKQQPCDMYSERYARP